MKRLILLLAACALSLGAVATHPIDRTLAHLYTVSDQITYARERVLGSAGILPERRALLEAEAAGMARANEIVLQRIAELEAARASVR